MKKRYLAIAGLLVLAVAAAGCGKEKDKPAEQQVQATPTVTPQVTEAADLVDMEVSDEKNVIGEKTATASKVAIVNRTGLGNRMLFISVSIRKMRKRQMMTSGAMIW